MTIKTFFIFLQDIRPFEEVGCAGFLELVQHTVQLHIRRHYTMFILLLFIYIQMQMQVGFITEKYNKVYTNLHQLY